MPKTLITDQRFEVTQKAQKPGQRRTFRFEIEAPASIARFDDGLRDALASWITHLNDASLNLELYDLLIALMETMCKGHSARIITLADLTVNFIYLSHHFTEVDDVYGEIRDAFEEHLSKRKWSFIFTTEPGQNEFKDVPSAVAGLPEAVLRNGLYRGLLAIFFGSLAKRALGSMRIPINRMGRVLRLIVSDARSFSSFHIDDAALDIEDLVALMELFWDACLTDSPPM